MRRRFWATLLVCLFTTPVCLAQPPGPPGRPAPKDPPAVKKAPTKADAELDTLLKAYLTKDGYLTAPVEVRDEERNFGVFWGVTWRVEANGGWSVVFTARNVPSLLAQGQLTKPQIRQLAIALARNDALKLASVGRPLVNPHVLTVTFGAATAALTFGVDQHLPPTNPLQPHGDPVGRIGAIAGAVRAAVDASSARPIVIPPPRAPR